MPDEQNPFAHEPATGGDPNPPKPPLPPGDQPKAPKPFNVIEAHDGIYNKLIDMINELPYQHRPSVRESLGRRLLIHKANLAEAPQRGKDPAAQIDAAGYPTQTGGAAEASLRS